MHCTFITVDPHCQNSIRVGSWQVHPYCYIHLCIFLPAHEEQHRSQQQWMHVHKPSTAPQCPAAKHPRAWHVLAASRTGEDDTTTAWDASNDAEDHAKADEAQTTAECTTIESHSTKVVVGIQAAAAPRRTKKTIARSCRSQEGPGESIFGCRGMDSKQSIGFIGFKMLTPTHAAQAAAS